MTVYIITESFEEGRMPIAVFSTQEKAENALGEINRNFYKNFGYSKYDIFEFEVDELQSSES
jgi:hypothetical protein